MFYFILVLINNNNTDTDAVWYFKITVECSQTGKEKFDLTQYVFIFILQQVGVGANEVQVVFWGDVVAATECLQEQFTILAYRAVHHAHVSNHCLWMTLWDHWILTWNETRYLN